MNSGKTHTTPGGAPAMEHSQDALTTSVTPGVTSSTSTTATSDPGMSKFDPSNYRQAQNVRMEESAVLTQKVQTIIPVRKPHKKQFVFAHPSPKFRAENMPTIEDAATGEIYLLAANLEFPVDIENKIDYLNLAAAITAEGSLFLWFYKNSTNSWSDSARIAIREASRGWVRVIADKSSNGYFLERPIVSPPAPMWPALSFTEMLETAFGARYIDSLKHPLVKKLRGDFNV